MYHYLWAQPFDPPQDFKTLPHPVQEMRSINPDKFVKIVRVITLDDIFEEKISQKNDPFGLIDRVVSYGAKKIPNEHVVTKLIIF
jgi:hypothetical protein